ncbi:hypothetical protein Pmar_PMAR025825, partial [Perkinsus marinus ATCC 50983]
DKTCQKFLAQTCEHFGLWEPQLWRLVWKKGSREGEDLPDDNQTIEAAGLQHDDKLELVSMNSCLKRKTPPEKLDGNGGPRRRSSLDRWAEYGEKSGKENNFSSNNTGEIIAEKTAKDST